MNKNQIQNVFLAIVAAVLLLNLGVMFTPPANALGKTQYKAVEIQLPSDVQKVLDQQSAEGWEYVGSAVTSLIFKK